MEKNYEKGLNTEETILAIQKYSTLSVEDILDINNFLVTPMNNYVFQINEILNSKTFSFFKMIDIIGKQKNKEEIYKKILTFFSNPEQDLETLEEIKKLAVLNHGDSDMDNENIRNAYKIDVALVNLLSDVNVTGDDFNLDYVKYIVRLNVMKFLLGDKFRIRASGFYDYGKGLELKAEYNNKESLKKIGKMYSLMQI